MALAGSGSLVEGGKENFPDGKVYTSWDLLCDMADAEITVDGEVLYRHGRPVLWS